MSEWAETELGLACDRVTGRLNSNAAVPNGKYPFFTCSPETLAIDDFAFDTEALLLAGNNANGVFALKYYKGKFNAYQRTYVITPKDRTEFNIQFLYYQLNLRLNYFKEISQGTATKFLTAGILDDLPILYPKIDEQKTIVEILSSLDEKIELNINQIRSLEAISQTLFKRWFVEFEFPDENGQHYKSSGGVMQPSELGEIPVGWEVGTIGDFVAHKKESFTPGSQPETSFYHYSIPNFDDGQEPKLELGKSILSNKYSVMSGSILVSKLNPRFPRIWPVIDVPGELSVCSTEFQVLVPNENAYGFVFNLLKSLYVSSEMVIRASGTSGSHQRINPDDLLSIEVVHPDQDLIKRFHCSVIEGARKAQFNLDQISVLARLRDTLIPKLMSGELRVA